MRSRKLFLTLIGGWILFIVVDSANGRTGAMGVRSLGRPLRMVWFFTRALRTTVLFMLAVSTYLLIAQQGDGYKKPLGDKS